MEGTFHTIADWFLALTNSLFGPVDQFKTPAMLWFLLLIPAYLIWYILWYSPRRLVVPMSYDPKKFIASAGPNLAFLRFAPMVLHTSAMFLIVLALARPQSRFVTEDITTEGIDIMLLLDTSGSMEQDDFRPNRLEIAKEKAVEFIEGRDNDRIGIVLFAEDAFSYAPLTLDYNLLKKQIAGISTNIMPKEGTAIGSAIAIGINRMLESNSPSKVMILLSDGSSNRGQIDPLTAAGLAQEKNIRIYTIGIGRETPAAFGGQSTMDFDPETMKKVAEMTSGLFFHAQDPSGLGEIFAKISQMEKIKITENATPEEYDVYPRVLIWAGIFLLISYALMITFFYNPLEE